MVVVVAGLGLGLVAADIAATALALTRVDWRESFPEKEGAGREGEGKGEGKGEGEEEEGCSSVNENERPWYFRPYTRTPILHDTQYPVPGYISTRTRKYC